MLFGQGLHPDHLNAEARSGAGFGHQKFGQVGRGTSYEVSALGAPSLSDSPCIGTCARGLKGYVMTSTVHERPVPVSSTVWPAARTTRRRRPASTAVSPERRAGSRATSPRVALTMWLTVLPSSERADADDASRCLRLPGRRVGARAQVHDQALVGQRAAQRVAPQRGQRRDARERRAHREPVGGDAVAGRTKPHSALAIRTLSRRKRAEPEVLVQHARVDLVRGRGGRFAQREVAPGLLEQPGRRRRGTSAPAGTSGARARPAAARASWSAPGRRARRVHRRARRRRGLALRGRQQDQQLSPS